MSWYTKLTIFALPSDFKLDITTFEQGVEAEQIRECNSSNAFTFGFVPHFMGSKVWTHKVEHCISVKAAKEIRAVNTTVLNQQLVKKVAGIEALEGRKVGRKEKADLKDELLYSLRAVSPTKRDYIECYIDLKAHLVIVNSTNLVMIELLHKALMSANENTFPITPLTTEVSVGRTMSDWLSQNSIPASLETGHFVKLIDNSEDKPSIEFKKFEPLSEDITRHLEQGMQVNSLGLRYSEKLTFVLNDSLQVSKLKFDDILKDQAYNESQGGEASDFDSSFSIMTLQIRDFFNSLQSWFGVQNHASN